VRQVLRAVVEASRECKDLAASFYWFTPCETEAHGKRALVVVTLRPGEATSSLWLGSEKILTLSAGNSYYALDIRLTTAPRESWVAELVNHLLESAGEHLGTNLGAHVDLDSSGYLYVRVGQVKYRFTHGGVAYLGEYNTRDGVKLYLSATARRFLYFSDHPRIEKLVNTLTAAHYEFATLARVFTDVRCPFSIEDLVRYVRAHHDVDGIYWDGDPEELARRLKKAVAFYEREIRRLKEELVRVELLG